MECLTALIIAKVRRIYGDRKANGAIAGSPAEVQKDGGLRIIYTPRGYTLTPVSDFNDDEADIRV